MDDLTAISIHKAREFAQKYPESYVPDNIREFVPHTWVLEAIKDAYRRGMRDERSGVPY